jgi:DNA-binding transcriptional regulator YhcF (GntR family)
MSPPADNLHDLDPDDPRTPSQQIANALRAAILTDRLAAGDKLPSQHDLARRYGVARETVKSALRLLDREQLVVSRQGSGVFVRSRRGPSLDLPALLRSAFDRSHVSIDYAGFNAEALSNTLTPTLAEIRAGRLHPRSLRLRIMVVDPTAPVSFPRPLADTAGDPAVRQQLAVITRHAITRLTDAVTELADRRLIRSATVEARVHELAPTFKLYLLNNEQALFGFYPVTQYSLKVKDGPVELHYPSGWDGTLFGVSADDGVSLSGPPFTEQAQAWYESVWSTLARKYKP